MLFKANKLFLAIAIIAMPNLYYRAQYNVPLLLFCFAVWEINRFKPVAMYALIFSWIIDVICMVRAATLINSATNTSSSKPLVLFILQAVVFVLKIAVVIFLVATDRQARQSLVIDNMCQYFRQEKPTSVLPMPLSPVRN